MRASPFGRYAIFGAVVVAVLALLSGLLAELVKSFDQGVVGPVVARSDREKANVFAIGVFARNRATRGDVIPLRITLVNHSDEPITGLGITRVQAPGLALRTSLASANNALPQQLGPSESVDIHLELVARARSGQHGAAVFYAWREAGMPRLDVLTVGPVTVSTRLRSTLVRVGSPILALFKDLALPVVLAIGAWLLQRYDKRRELASREADARLAAQRKEDEEHRSRVQAAWSLMLPVSHRFNTRYYLPILRMVDKVESSILGKKPPRTSLYFFLSLWRHMKQLAIDNGGLFLKDTRGEELIVAAWNMIYRQTDENIELRLREAALAKMKWHEELATFEGRFSTAGPDGDLFRRIETAFQKWLKDDFEDLLVPLRLFRQVFLHELNRPFALWYDQPHELEVAELRKVDEDLARLEWRDARKEPWVEDVAPLRQQLKAYLQLRQAPAGSA